MNKEKLSVENGVINDIEMFREKMLDVVRLYGRDNVRATQYGRCIEKGLEESIFTQGELDEKNNEYFAISGLRHQEANTPELIGLCETLIDSYLS
ncbi:MAG: hypothetical protein KAT91_01670 [Candidatus Aenigmarchaeota archaeon]|nr:hypothetical protein [Candidatus Aenigmarchaeota archaeon]